MTGRPPLPGGEAFPSVSRHLCVWLALGRARLPGSVRPSPEYEARLVGLMCRFLAPGSVPDREEFAASVDDALDELRDVMCADGGAPTGQHESAWERAVHWLKVADAYAEKTLG